jgi:hypothetical protein
MAAIENAADSKKCCGFKNHCGWQNHDGVKIKAGPKILGDGEIHVATEKQAVGKILAGVEISAPDKIPAAIEKPAEAGKQAACLLFRLGGISSC